MLLQKWDDFVVSRPHAARTRCRLGRRFASCLRKCLQVHIITFIETLIGGETAAIYSSGVIAAVICPTAFG